MYGSELLGGLQPPEPPPLDPPLKHSAESSPPPGQLPPISFEGQLIVVGSNNNYEKAKLYFHSPVTNSWVSIENAPHIGNVVGIANLSHSKSLVLIYNESGKYTSCQNGHTKR